MLNKFHFSIQQPAAVSSCQQPEQLYQLVGLDLAIGIQNSNVINNIIL